MKTRFLIVLSIAIGGFTAAPGWTNQLKIAQVPLFVGSVIPPHVMLNMSVDSQLFFSAFPEFADLSGDGQPDRGYVHSVDYFGYLDPYKCYSYSTGNGRFVPQSETEDKYCSGSNWSGNFLNWLSMARIDTVRAILYGGKRHIDEDNLTVLERTYLPTDAHSWVKFYDGPDLANLTPFAETPETVATSTSAVSWVTPDPAEQPTGWNAVNSGPFLRNNEDYRQRFVVPVWAAADAQVGDQVRIIRLDATNQPPTWLDEDGVEQVFSMQGVIRNRDSTGGNTRIEVQITGSDAPDGWSGDFSNWRIVNESRRGVSFCNTTRTTGSSQGATALGAPPLMRVARGDYSLWTANERWQCKWSNERSRTAPNKMRVGGLNFSNGNDLTSSRLFANSDNPVRADVGLGNSDYQVRVEVCVEGLVGTERCKAYGPDDILKPIGLLQEFGEDGRIRFGLMTGSFTQHVSGGVLRKNMGTFGDEVNSNTGQFTFTTTSDSIVRSLDSLRIFGYNHDSGEYRNAGDDCRFGTSKAQMVGGRCFSWGNPQAEIFAESLRYLSGLEPNDDFTHTGNDRITGLQAAEWNNPITEDLWCTPKTVIQFNASVTSFDNDAQAAAAGLEGSPNVDTWTNIVGTGEAFPGQTVFHGGGGGGTDEGFCTPRTLGNLADIQGICPEAPNQDGTYHIAGLAHYAYMTDLRPDWTGEQTVRTIGVSLAPAVPRINVLPEGTVFDPDPDVSLPEPSVVILPACDNQGETAASPENLRCQLADFRIIEQDLEAGTGSFFIQWDVAEWGADFDSDLNGTLSYEISGNSITVTTETWTDSSGRRTGFGYIISGVTQPGFQAHSGINGYARPSANGALGCNNCRVADDPTSFTYTIDGGAAELLREPLFYAAKWGGYDKSRNFPSDPQSWDATGDESPDNYFFAVDPAQLFVSLRRAFQQVIDLIETTTLETTSSRLETGTLVYQAGFDTRDWSGDVTALDPFEPQGQRLEWSATDTVSPADWSSRRIVTSFEDTGYLFDPVTLPAGVMDELIAGVEQLENDGDCAGLDAESWFCNVTPAELVNFLRGDISNSQGEGEFLRDRSSLIGDIVNSEIVLNPALARVNEGWTRIDSAYADFVEEKISRVEEDKAVVFVGSNNGMLHAFNAKNGNELFAFIPSMVHANLHKLANPNYQHQFYVDGSLTVADAFLPGRGWRTVLVGALGAGGKGLFALDVTTPESFTTDDVLWELTPESEDADNLGHVFGLPQITRLGDANGTFVAIVGNGFNGANNAPSLLTINLADGEVLQSYSPTIPENQRPDHNGLAAPTIVLDEVTRSFVSNAYAGDLSGRMWRFDFRNGDVDAHREIFRAQVGSGANAADQAITSAPNVTTSVEGGLNLYFGTGRFFVEGDELVVAPVQSFYKVRDVNQSSPYTRSDLGRARISDEDNGVRAVVVDTFDDGGWYLDLEGPGGADPGERVLVRPEVIAGRVIFATFQPSAEPCDGGGIPRLYVLNAGSGGGALGFSGMEMDSGGGIQIIGVGSPLNPPVVISPPPPRDPGDLEDPLVPIDPEDPPVIPPSGDGLDRSSWCSRVGYLNPLNQEFQPLAALCDGRQVWRQIW